MAYHINSNLSLSCVDLFAGAGGFSLAAKNAGLKLKLAVENNRHAAATYRANLCNGPNAPIIYENDINSLSPSKVYSEIFGSAEFCDLILGGPPCQGFSTHRINNSGVNDERNCLIHTYFNFVKVFLPSVFLMENVPGMLWSRHQPYLDQFYDVGRKAGYQIAEPIIVDARDFGVPQRRKRVFILGIKADLNLEALNWPPVATHGNDKTRIKYPHLDSWKNCSSAFEDAPVGDKNDIHMTHSKELKVAFENTPKNGGSRKSSGRVLRCHQDHDGHKDVYGRIDPNLPGPTMTTACINPSKGRFVHPTQHHGITVRQAARLQTFPDDYIFEGGLIASGVQIGNAVPVVLGTFLIEQLKPLLIRAHQMRIKKTGISKAA